ncbi:MAG: class I SAM-dependent methyltransferase [Dissulfurispiraceae bacterium]
MKFKGHGKTVRKYRNRKELPVIDSVYKRLGVDDVNEFYANKFVGPPPPNLVECDPASKFNIGFFKQYWIYNNIKGNTTVLDVGSGSGTLNLLKSKNVHLVGTDLSEKALEQALLAGYDEVVMCDSFDTPFPDKTFDYIVSLDVLGHIENELKDIYINEWVRILKDDGVMLHGIESVDIDYNNLDEGTKKYILIDGHVGLESFDKVKERFKRHFREVTAENFIGSCYNWHDIKKYDGTEERVGKEFRDYLLTFTPDQVIGFNAAMLLMRNLLLKDNLLGKSGGFMFIKATQKAACILSDPISPQS